MKLREYLESMAPGSELTCWDKDVDSEFYFYAKDPDEKDERDEDFLAVDACMDKLAAMLDVVEFRERGVIVNLYDMLDHPRVIQFAKDNFYLSHQYENDDDVVMLLFDDNDSNITNGFIEFSKDMVKCLEQAYGPAGEKYQISQIKELEKHLDDAEHIRVGIAQMGIRLDRFVIDESWQVRKAVAENGYGLGFLMDDPHWAVRKAVAKQGYALEVLSKDKDWRVVEEVRRTSKRQEFEIEMSERRDVRHEGDVSMKSTSVKPSGIVPKLEPHRGYDTFQKMVELDSLKKNEGRVFAEIANTLGMEGPEFHVVSKFGSHSGELTVIDYIHKRIWNGTEFCRHLLENVCEFDKDGEVIGLDASLSKNLKGLCELYGVGYTDYSMKSSVDNLVKDAAMRVTEPVAESKDKDLGMS